VVLCMFLLFPIMVVSPMIVWQVGWACINKVLQQASTTDDLGLDHRVPFISTWNKTMQCASIFQQCNNRCARCEVATALADSNSCDLSFHFVGVKL